MVRGRKRKGSSLKGTRIETRLPRLQAEGKMSGSWSQSREGQALFSWKWSRFPWKDFFSPAHLGLEMAYLPVLAYAYQVTAMETICFGILSESLYLIVSLTGCWNWKFQIWVLEHFLILHHQHYQIFASHLLGAKPDANLSRGVRGVEREGACENRLNLEK